MELQRLFLMAALSSTLAGEVRAQEPAAPPSFRLPAGARVRVSVGGDRPVEALLARQDESGVALVFPSESPLVPPSEMVIPSASIARLEMSLGKKRHALIGALVGAVALGLTGLSDPVDTSENCTATSSTACSRAEAIGIAAVAGALIGGVAGHLVQTERWTPVALDAIAPPPPTARETHAAPGGATVPARDGGPLRLSFRF